MEEQLYYRTNLYRRLVLAKLFIEKNYQDNINVDLIADESCFSKFHFIRLFKRIYGFTPHQYLIRVRVDKAKELLEQDYPVEEVCALVGFESVSSFSALFKRRNGISPSLYQLKRHRLRQDRKQRPHKYIPGCHILAFGFESDL